jgi:hypothetical protein
MSVIHLPAVGGFILSAKAYLFVKKPACIQDEACNNSPQGMS